MKTEIFKDVLLVGNRISKVRIVCSIIAVIFISVFLTGFGYQPFWLFILVLFIGLFLTLPACFNDYWLIYNDRIVIHNFSKYSFIKLAQLLGLIKMDLVVLKFDDIKSAELEYVTKKRISPFDITGDYFWIHFDLKNETKVTLPVTKDLSSKIPDFVQLLNEHNIIFNDQQQIVKLILQHEDLFTHFNLKRYN